MIPKSLKLLRVGAPQPSPERSKGARPRSESPRKAGGGEKSSRWRRRWHDARVKEETEDGVASKGDPTKGGEGEQKRYVRKLAKADRKHKKEKRSRSRRKDKSKKQKQTFADVPLLTSSEEAPVKEAPVKDEEVSEEGGIYRREAKPMQSESSGRHKPKFLVLPVPPKRPPHEPIAPPAPPAPPRPKALLPVQPPYPPGPKALLPVPPRYPPGRKAPMLPLLQVSPVPPPPHPPGKPRPTRSVWELANKAKSKAKAKGSLKLVPKPPQWHPWTKFRPKHPRKQPDKDWWIAWRKQVKLQGEACLGSRPRWVSPLPTWVQTEGGDFDSQEALQEVRPHPNPRAAASAVHCNGPPHVVRLRVNYFHP